MKRLRTLAFVLSCVCLIAAFGCAAKPEKSLHDHGLELIQTMDEMAKSEAYIAMTTGSEYMTEMLLPVQEGSVGEPTAVYTITLRDEYLSMMAEWAEMPEIPESIKALANQKLIGAFATQINALGGAQKLSASAICAAGKTFVNESLTENVIYLYVFESCPPAAVTFTPGEDGAVSASGLFLLYDEVDFGSEAALRAFFAEMGAELAVYGG